KRLQERGIDAVYLPFRVPRGDLGGFLKMFDGIPVHGYSVTIPHKEAAAALAVQRDDAVRLTGAANTLLLDPAGWKAYNTDFPAAVEALAANLPPGPDGVVTPLHSRTMLLLGAGGV